MLKQLEKIREEGFELISSATDVEKLEAIRKELTGKKSSLQTVLKSLGSIDPVLRKSVGMKANEVKNLFAEKIREKEEELVANASVIPGELDLTLPGIEVSGGMLHPITQMCYDLNDAFRSLGFEIYNEDDISSEKFAFDNLNFAADHPARASMDTYWLEGTEDKRGNERLCLRPHLTGGSVRYLLKHGAPARFVYPGRVYRNETTDARHERAFFQYEALIVDKDVSFSSGRVMIETILEKVFGRKVNVRMREGFFPFTEPGYEIDMECLLCGGKGCKACNQAGWIEVMPGGVIHPNVLRAADLDPDVWTGFYTNIGLDRLVMMRYGVDDVRLFHSADLRFLRQFR
jgi:phenylalanyl-tRNA synthetase alpha chain